MKIIDFDSIRSLGITPTDCYSWVDEMILHKDMAFLPAKTHMNLPGNIFCNVMPSILHLPEGSFGGVKVVTRYPERTPSLDSKILLFNAEDGEFLALMDGNWITAMRTGAVAAHSILLFAKQGFERIGMIGLGNVSRSTLLVLYSLIDRPLSIRLLKYKDQAELFIERFRDYKNLDFTIVESIEECIRGSEVVVSGATYFEDDIAEDTWFDEGVLVVPVHTRGFTNCDLFFDKVFADDTGHVKDFRHFAEFKQYAEVTDVVNGKAKGRESESERILAYNIGVSIHDIYFASQIYRRFKENPQKFSALKDAKMNDPETKFWV